MVDRKVVVGGAVAVVAVLVIGGIAGAMVLGGGGGDTPTPDDGEDDADDGSDGGSAATPTPAATTAGDGTAANGTGNGTAANGTNGTATAFPTVTPTSAPTPTATGTPTVTPTPTAIPTRTPILPRKFEEREIELELRRMINDWRDRKGLQPFTNANGSLVKQINRMATNHSVAMSENGELVHESNGLSTGERYRAFGLADRCKFKKQDAQYIVDPENDAYQFEVLHKTYAGRNYEEGGETVYHENETAVARDIFQEWKSNPVYRDVLDYPEINRLGIGIELTEDNEVWATGNICEGGKKNE
ncbi:hypothetical protein HZS55_17030 [Halosimplex rubrum]|uniref:CAP domain-containing protein n=1 Tax=Halosimplex rubrum TaxID=869889 RepID=A0A7D5T5Y1_9EURY|nr:hypothetical protein [Halosimplex rubrum]QLH78890.1 hypothetical protein HZS55_17030 [Halosimplex rubrum]